MKYRFGKIISLAVIPIILGMASADKAAAQTSMGILPVNVPSTGPSVLNPRQWQSVSLQLQESLAGQLLSLGTISKLSREHILLLLKEAPAADPENLEAQAYVTISKKEKLQYLLKCVVESVRVNGKNVLAPIRVIIVDGRTGKVFWEDVNNKYRVISGLEVNEQILLEDVFKPAINEISREILNLHY